jgi:hypothetical protein
MATSGTSVLSRNRDEIIGRALRLCGAFEAGETPDAESVNQAADVLNAMIKHWQADGINIWTSQEAILFLQNGQRQYTMSSSSSDHATASFVNTTLTADAADGASTITVDAVTGISSSYNIGVQLDDGTLQWTTVNGAPAGAVVTLTAALTDSASSGNLVVCYQNKLVRPLKVLSARRYNFASDLDTPLQIMDRIEYAEMPNKGSESTVNSIYYDRRGGANTSGLLYLWPTPSTVDEAIKMTVARPIEIFSAAANDPDLPEEWIRTLEWNLADELADEYDVPEPKRSRIEKRAATFLAEVTWWERELTEVQFVPDMRAG